MKQDIDTFTADCVALVCPVCSSPLPESKSRPFSFCGNACRQKSYRQRKSALRISENPKKALRISEKPKKALRISEKTNVVNLPVTAPVTPFQDTQNRPVIRSVSDLAAFFCS